MNRSDRNAASPMMTPGEAASAFRVDTRTLARWCRDGKIPYITTPGGHRRYPRAEVMALTEATRTEVES